MLFKLRCENCDGTGFWLLESKPDETGLYIAGVKCEDCGGKGYISIWQYIFLKFKSLEKSISEFQK